MREGDNKVNQPTDSKQGCRITAEMLLEQLRFIPNLTISPNCERHVLDLLKTAIVNARADGKEEILSPPILPSERSAGDERYAPLAEDRVEAEKIVGEMWVTLKQQESVDPNKAVRIVMLTEDQLRRAVSPTLATFAACVRAEQREVDAQLAISHAGDSWSSDLTNTQKRIAKAITEAIRQGGK